MKCNNLKFPELNIIFVKIEKIVVTLFFGRVEWVVFGWGKQIGRRGLWAFCLVCLPIFFETKRKTQISFLSQTFWESGWSWIPVSENSDGFVTRLAAKWFGHKTPKNKKKPKHAQVASPARSASCEARGEGGGFWWVSQQASQSSWIHFMHPGKVAVSLLLEG